MTRVISSAGPRERAQPESLPLTVLAGLRILPEPHGSYVYGHQLRAAARIGNLHLVLTAVCLFLVDFRFYAEIPTWMLAGWSLLVIGVHTGAWRMRLENARSDYAGITRQLVLRHGGWAAMQGLAWGLALVVLADGASPDDHATCWTIACCLMAAVAVGYQSTPLSAFAYILALGGGAIWMMHQHTDPLLLAVVTTYTLVLTVSSLRQAHLFGVQLMTNRLLAEKREVVSLLLKEHDAEGSDWLWQTDIAHRLTGVTPGFAAMLGCSSEEVESRSILEVLAGPGWQNGSCDKALHELAEKLKLRQPFSELVLPVATAGTQRWWEISASPRIDEQGNFLGFHGVGSDITEEKESSERISLLARHDMLTGLPNRLQLTEELGSEIGKVSRFRTRCGFLMIDLDRFKAVNDTLGHLVGDQLLAQVADRLSRVCTANEICGRLGGDEFAVILRDVPDALYVDQLARRIIESVSDPYVIDNHTMFIGATIGSAIAPQDGANAETLMHSADLAMYRAKESGRGQHLRFMPEMHEEAEQRHKMEVALRDALANDQMHLVFQPLVRSSTGDLAGFEALARWTHPELGVVEPTRFIPMAEEARLIVPIGNWVLRAACEQAARWPVPVGISVNISAEQLYDSQFIETVMSALAHSRIDPRRLEIEVVESALLGDSAGAMEKLEKLIDMGVRLSLDDFGSGYSALGFLSRSRFSTIKIDQKFIGGATRNDRESLAVAHAAVALAKTLGMEAVAEGVETRAEFQFATGLGCSLVQGFYFGRPMEVADVDALFGGASAQVA